jgi:hypothetical protein
LDGCSRLASEALTETVLLPNSLITVSAFVDTLILDSSKKGQKSARAPEAGDALARQSERMHRMPPATIME